MFKDKERLRKVLKAANETPPKYPMIKFPKYPNFIKVKTLMWLNSKMKSKLWKIF